MSAQRTLNDLAFYLFIGDIVEYADECGRVFVRDRTERLLVYIGQVQPREEDAAQGERNEK